MEDTGTHAELKKKSLSGIYALMVRQVFVKAIFFAGNIILARILVPEVFGIYAIVNFVIQFFSTFGDVGIGAALIQKKGELTREELSTTFWLQQILACFVAGIAIFAAPLALKVYPSLPTVGVWLIRAMAASFLFSSLKTIPAILMERNIDFNRIAWVDVGENLVFQLVAISCGLMGFAAWSFVFAAITRSLCGAVLIYALSPWRPSFHCRIGTVKDLVKFGLPYQGNQILSFVKDAVTPLFVGAFAGAAAVGYVNWARNFAFTPLMISEGFGRVAFPAFSRLQDNKVLLTRTIERSIRMMTVVMFPVTAIMFALGAEITHVVFTDKWMPGMAAFYFYCTSPLLIGVMLPMYSAILSLGRSDLLLKMTAGLIILEWSLGVPFVLKFGFNGISFSQPIIVAIFYFVYKHLLTTEGVRLTLFCNVRSQLAAALVSAVTVKATASTINASVAVLFLLLVAGFFVYAILLFLLNKGIVNEFREYLAKMLGKGVERV
ncbi:oligosaccharide flippase family protein [Geobacter sp.]|uniref:oligosaccharide flippase family protein n=1 Tax=Geobacter sp. TaxID=46610 RepID=UPI002623E375|nr:oligosaccharide flippase family protein [Geobacter sp.]